MINQIFSNMDRVKTGGRKLGTPNKTTAETKEMLQNIVSENLKNYW